MHQFGKAIRHYWHLEDCIFLNHGSFGATPIKVLAAQHHWQQQLEHQPVRFMKQELEPALHHAAHVLADHLGGVGKNLAFVDNATSGVNTVLRSLPWQPGDRLLATTHSYGAIRKALAFVCDRYQVALTEIAIPFPIKDSAEILTLVTKALTDPSAPLPKLLVIDHITSPTGLLFPLEDILTQARAVGVPVLVDGAHAPGMIPLHLDALQADWYVGNCHKWLCAPKGCAFLYTHPDRQAITHPLTISHGYRSGYSTEFAWTGTRDFSSWLAVTAAVDFQEELGTLASQAYNYDLLWQAAQSLADRWQIDLPAPPTLLRTMATLPLPPQCSALPPDTLHDQLWQEYRIEVPIIPFNGQSWLRISTQVYNTRSEYENLGTAILAIGGGGHKR